MITKNNRKITMLPDERNMIYISGPITGIEDWESIFMAAEKELKCIANVSAVVNPCRLAFRVQYRFLGSGNPRYTDYMREDIRGLSVCNYICMLPGWKRSKGARIEYRIAKILNMTILEYIPGN